MNVLICMFITQSSKDGWMYLYVVSHTDISLAELTKDKLYFIREIF